MSTDRMAPWILFRSRLDSDMASAEPKATDKKGSRHALRVAHFCPGVLHTALA